MAVRQIRLWPDPVLSTPCAAADLADPALPALIDDLFDSMYAAQGRGLAAPQIGVLTSVFVVDVTWKEGARDPRAFFNPTIVSVSEDISMMDEQCLSIPDLPMPVARPDTVTLHWQTLDGSTQTDTFDGILARCILHEHDHLLGRVIFDHQPPTARADLEARYAP